MTENARTTKQPDLNGLTDLVLEISRKRREILHRMKDALLRDDTNEVLKCAQSLCGLEDWEIEAHRRNAARAAKRKQRSSKAKTKK